MKFVYRALGAIFLSMFFSGTGKAEYKAHPEYPFIRPDGVVAVYSNPTGGDPTISN